MSFDILLFVLRAGFLIVLYAFLVAVVKVAWTGLRKSADAREAIRPPSSLVRLRVVSSGNNGVANEAFDLWSSATLGRAPDNTIVLPDGSVSAHHAAIRQEHGQWWVEDLHSTNGTAVNETWVHGTAAVYPGDVIRLGQALLRLEVDDAQG
ncbi:MAG TPA: FHA domain-containing protein [Chloroflexota bacterium]|nr:FHA domain-containing protein [Chloroflexota bacterium]